MNNLVAYTSAIRNPKTLFYLTKQNRRDTMKVFKYETILYCKNLSYEK